EIVAAGQSRQKVTLPQRQPPTTTARPSGEKSMDMDPDSVLAEPRTPGGVIPAILMSPAANIPFEPPAATKRPSGEKTDETGAMLPIHSIGPGVGFCLSETFHCTMRPSSVPTASF